MEMNESEKNVSLKDVLGGFIQSYAQRDTDMAFSDWLAGRLRQELPGMEQEASTRLADDIIGAIAGYDQTLHDLNQAIETGQPKEEWLSEQLEKVYDDMTIDAAGESLLRMEAELVSSNMQLMGETDRPVAEELLSVVESEPIEWNRYGVEAEVTSIGQMLNSVALCAAANALDRNLNGEKAAINDIVADALQNGLKASPSEVKAVVAGAVRASAEKGLMDTLPPDTPIDVIGDFAGVAVEGAEALCDAVNGSITITDAMDKVGRAGVAAGCRAGAGFLKGKLMALGGPVLVDFMGGLLDHIESPQFINNVHTTLKGVAVATWDGIKKSAVGKIVRKVASTVGRTEEKVAEKPKQTLSV